jgi:hypothetical protein
MPHIAPWSGKTTCTPGLAALCFSTKKWGGGCSLTTPVFQWLSICFQSFNSVLLSVSAVLPCDFGHFAPFCLISVFMEMPLYYHMKTLLIPRFPSRFARLF